MSKSLHVSLHSLILVFFSLTIIFILFFFNLIPCVFFWNFHLNIKLQSEYSCRLFNVKLSGSFISRHI